VTAAASRLLPVPFIFLRHGETDWNTQNLAQGRTEVALNQRGLAQAAIAADALQNRGIVTIVASPLIRAKLTADIVAEKLGISVQLDNGLVECAYGEKEGLPMHDWFQHWVDGEYTPHGAESFLALRDRVAGALNRCLQLPGPVLVVAHGAVMRALRAEMLQTANVRTPNAAPLFCTPPTAGEAAWIIENLPVADAPVF
jgi:probable phosphoglycerate mutase